MTSIHKAQISPLGADVANISVVEATLPPPSPHEIQVRVLYSGFSGADVEMRLGRYPMQRRAPLTPGYSMVGRVETLGTKCTTTFHKDDIVAALTVYDAQAELINLEEKHLVPVPETLSRSEESLQQVTAIALDWNTAFGMVESTAKVTADQRIFIHGLSGACGYALMVLCLLKGAKVYGTASERNHATLRELGANPFVYTDKKWITAMQDRGGAHVVFDALGFESFDESYSILAAEGGIVVAYGGNKAALEGEKAPSILSTVAKFVARNLKVWSGKRMAMFAISRDAKAFRPGFETLMRMVVEGKIQPPIKKVYEMTTESLREAHAGWGKTPGMGSVVIKVAGVGA